MTKKLQSELSSIDLFAGCGGLSLGLEMSGFKTLLYSELNKDASATYSANRSDPGIIAVGDIYSLSDAEILSHLATWKKRGISDIDLVAGGPPCQGYSKIGHRRTFDLEKADIPSNQLFKEMVRVINSVRPRAFLFENVSGLLTARWTENGPKGEIFRDVLNTFIKIPGYSVRWQLVHAKDYGVPQNRPRVLIVGFRNDVAEPKSTAIRDDITVIKPTAIVDGYLPPPTGKYPDLVDLLGDLVDPQYEYGSATMKYPSSPQPGIQKWLRTTKDGRSLGKGQPILDHEYSDHKPHIREKFLHMIRNNGIIPERMRTKKFAQRLLPERWGPDGPNITATSLPDDFVHFSQPRILTVREWARLQTFPDWYKFLGPRTTGGRRRAGDPGAGLWARDVPKYTQIGNAVPVGLAQAVAVHLASVLRSRN